MDSNSQILKNKKQKTLHGALTFCSTKAKAKINKSKSIHFILTDFFFPYISLSLVKAAHCQLCQTTVPEHDPESVVSH